MYISVCLNGYHGLTIPRFYALLPQNTRTIAFMDNSVLQGTEFSIAKDPKLTAVRVLWRTVAFLYDGILCTVSP
jgi:hypothetical protein